ncbi:TrkH family potassium uptake protein [Aliigemmobacter aestuarii]|uniref:Trk system potassium uptake protein n=2 Tax=Aliigemmobacter aestuarii TaxID=1445661 RepID=A0A4S3MKH3_9RHOB|nr:TrkH family potassium uptake protein [Gemmobacter aestuarii]
MIDLRSVAYILGRLLVVFGILMLVPALVDLIFTEDQDAGAYLLSAGVTAGTGGMVVLATRNALGRALDFRSATLLTLGIWLLMPLFGALPFILGAPQLSFTDGYFEAASGVTTTGATVIVGLEGYPVAMNLWRGMLNWTGGLGVAFLAMIFLPVMRIGGMQFFRSEGFDTFGKVLPRASDIARSLFQVYAWLTVAAAACYLAAGMTPLDAAVHAMASISTGGFSASDASFGKYPGAGEYAGALFMILGALPYVRYIELSRGGSPRPIWRDVQVRAFLVWMAVAVMACTLWRKAVAGGEFEDVFRDALFNIVSIFTGTGFFSGSFASWGGFALAVAFAVGFVGGCSGSSTGALSVFRVQIAAAAIGSAIRSIPFPDRLSPIRYGGRSVDMDTINGLILFISAYVVVFGLCTVAVSFTGVDLESSIFAVWASLGNIGYGFGPLVAPTGTFIDFPETAKWALSIAMLTGRLSLLSFLVILLPAFWRN